jgi:hypothetical protein
LSKAKNVAEGVKAHIQKVIWDETAITHKPVNDHTLGTVSIIPFEQFAKALMAGGGVDAANFSGGRAITPESLMGATADVAGPLNHTVPYGELKALWDGLLAAVRDQSIVSYNDAIVYIVGKGYPSNVTAELIDFVSKKLPEIFGGQHERH